MSRNLTELAGYAVDATDGEIGKVHDFLFDDERWTIRYLVVQTGGFFDDRRVLISPVSFAKCTGSTGGSAST
jgi:sporulation protein YlmC with PRC-barrel domain